MPAEPKRETSGAHETNTAQPGGPIQSTTGTTLRGTKFWHALIALHALQDSHPKCVLSKNFTHEVASNMVLNNLSLTISQHPTTKMIS